MEHNFFCQWGFIRLERQEFVSKEMSGRRGSGACIRLLPFQHQQTARGQVQRNPMEHTTNACALSQAWLPWSADPVKIAPFALRPKEACTYFSAKSMRLDPFAHWHWKVLQGCTEFCFIYFYGLWLRSCWEWRFPFGRSARWLSQAKPVDEASLLVAVAVCTVWIREKQTVT